MERFDYDEAFEEGMELYGNRDEAEAYADDKEMEFRNKEREREQSTSTTRSPSNSSNIQTTGCATFIIMMIVLVLGFMMFFN